MKKFIILYTFFCSCFYNAHEYGDTQIVSYEKALNEMNEKWVIIEKVEKDKCIVQYVGDAKNGDEVTIINPRKKLHENWVIVESYGYNVKIRYIGNSRYGENYIILSGPYISKDWILVDRKVEKLNELEAREYGQSRKSFFTIQCVRGAVYGDQIQVNVNIDDYPPYDQNWIVINSWIQRFENGSEKDFYILQYIGGAKYGDQVQTVKGYPIPVNWVIVGGDRKIGQFYTIEYVGND